IFARVTWLLAIAQDGTIEQRASDVHVPVYLGDSMQWNVHQTHNMRDVAVEVPHDRPLHVPAGFAESQARFEPGLRAMTDGLRDGSAPETVGRPLRRIEGVDEESARRMTETYAHLRALYRSSRNGIWPFVLRNLRRPL
ncbi:MAG TPA: hypothetical protein VJ779_03115, partial [Acetobacteraceae bacterium]|nr:hypothetical protein [Acetobacteraceae bacterium]